MTMKEELAALKKKLDAGKITAFQFKKQSNKIKEKYGKEGEPSNVSKIFTYIRDTDILKASPKSAKGKAAAKAATDKAGLANRGKSQGGRTAAEDKKARPATKKNNFLAGLDLTKKRAAPKFNPSGLKVPTKKKAKAAPKKEKMYTAINIKTGKADFDAPKVTAAQRLKQEDKYKALNLVKKAAKSSMKKKKRG